MTTLIFRNKFVICELDDSVPVLKHRWLQPPPDQEFQQGLLNILKEYDKLAQTDNLKDLKWLADTELLGELSEEVEDWLVSTWDHKIFDESGVKVHAVILGSDLFADYPMEKFKMSSEDKFEKHGIRLGVFANEEQAYDWLVKN